MKKNFLLIVGAIFFMSVGLGISYYLATGGLMSFSPIEPKVEAQPDVLKEKDLTFSDVERSALEKWKQQGFSLTLRIDPKGELVAGEPGCRKYSYYLQYGKGGPGLANLIICGKSYTIEDARTSDQILKMITGPK